LFEVTKAATYVLLPPWVTNRTHVSPVYSISSISADICQGTKPHWTSGVNHWFSLLEISSSSFRIVTAAAIPETSM